MKSTKFVDHALTQLSDFSIKKNTIFFYIYFFQYIYSVKYLLNHIFSFVLNKVFVAATKPNTKRKKMVLFRTLPTTLP